MRCRRSVHSEWTVTSREGLFMICEADSGGSYIRNPRIRRSSTQGNRLRESKDQLHEAI